MGQAKKRKNEIEAIKAGMAIRLANGYDDYDTAALVIKKAAKFVHRNLGDGHYGYRISSWMGVETATDEDLKKVVKESALISDTPDRVDDVKKAIIELFKMFSEQFMLDELSPDGGKHPGRITNQKELDNAVEFYFRPVNMGTYVADSEPLSVITLSTKNADGSWNKTYFVSSNNE